MLFHFNPRFNQSTLAYFSKINLVLCSLEVFVAEEVVCNSNFNGVWGNEEVHGTFPFHYGKDFELLFRVEQDGFHVRVLTLFC